MATQTLRPLLLLRPLRSPCTFTSPIALHRLLLSQARHSQYHSLNHPPPPGPFTDMESAILERAAKYIPTHGFTLSALGQGAREAGYVDAAAANLFPRGAWSLVHWHLYTQRMGLGERVRQREEGWEGKGVPARVREVMWERLLANSGVVGRLQEALALSALPSNIPPSLEELGKLSSEILYLANENNVDFSWYTRRLSVSSVYAASELFMTTDKSEGFAETREFMESRFDDVEHVAGAVGGLGKWVNFELTSVLNLARSKGVKI